MVAQLVRALACHARGRGFEPHPSRHSQYASVAQLVEQRTENPRVVGSIPTGGTIDADLAHLVERHLAKVEVAGSSPVIRSKTKDTFECPFLFVLGGQGLCTCQEPCGLCGFFPVHFCVENHHLDTLGLIFSQRGTSLHEKRFLIVFPSLSP